MAAGARVARATSSTISGHKPAPSTASQTSWALLGLMAASAVDHPSVERGVDYLLAAAAERTDFGRRNQLHRDRFPARVLPSLSRLCEILPALGACPLPQSEGCQYHFSSGWNVSDNGVGLRHCRDRPPRRGAYCGAVWRSQSRRRRRRYGATGQARQAVSCPGRRGHNQLRYCRRSCASMLRWGLPHRPRGCLSEAAPIPPIRPGPQASRN